MTHCSHCGTQFDNTYRYCKNCGSALTGTLVQRSYARTAPRPFSNAVSVVPVAYAVSRRKSVGGALLLAGVFGPLGMLYSTVLGALVMLFVSIFLGSLTRGLSVLFTLPVCVIWAGFAAESHNRFARYATRLRRR